LNFTLLVAQIVGMMIVFGACLFGAAGTLRWPAGWAFMILFFGFTIALTAWLVRHNPALLTERMTGIGKADQKTWDKIFFAVMNVLFLAWLVSMPLDAVRYHWSRMPVWVQGTGAALMLVSFVLFFLTFRENTFLSPAVRVQTERGHAVVSTGPYSIVRHPMYAAAAIFLIATALLLGSWFGALLALVLVIAIAVRAVNEEETLRAELPGYDAYMQRVRFRIIPRVW
jgi:protein-S-isoprenylcysteine O-methyltransferase Ste14